MQRALAQFEYVRVAQKIRYLDADERRVGILLAIDEPLPQHFNQAREIWWRVDAEAGEMARVERAQHLEDHSARRRRRHRVDIVVGIAVVNGIAPIRTI